MNDFARLAASARPIVDGVFGEAAIFKPMDRTKGPHGARLPSTDRQETEIGAIFYQDIERAARNRAQPMIGQTGDRMLNRSPEIYCSTGYEGEIGVGDRILRKATGALFEIISRDGDGIGDKVFGLAAISGN